MYEYLGPGSSASTSRYKITVQHYINCERLADEPSNVYLGIFDAATNSTVTTLTIARTSTTQIQKQSFSSCISPVPVICFYLATYVVTTELANNTGGYVLAEQECCRASGIVNVSNPSSVGFTNVNTIPGVINGIVYRNNSSPVLPLKDTAVMCYNAAFTLDFGATDPDGDSLAYVFCSAKASGSTSRQPNPPSAPPYSDIPYQSGYTASTPMGSGVTINAATGLISGTAPAATGPYIITVCILEFRNGVQIGSTKKEVLVTVADCSLTAAALQPSYINCDNFSFSFQNESTSSNISSYLWNFDTASGNTDTSTQATPAYTYADTGTYTIKLVVTSSSGCTDSTTATVKVYPGFTPAFTVAGSCYQSPFQFTDASHTQYGTITSWAWDFGDASSASDTSSQQNPLYQYAAAGSYTATLSIASSKGCTGSVRETITANDKPVITLPFTDTLICSNDTLPLMVQSSSTSTYNWTPSYNIINASASNPLVFPQDTTVYTVTVKDNGCVDSATVTVNVLDYVTVSIPGDTAICAGDTITLRPVSYALSYAWTESSGLNTLSSDTVKYPQAWPAASTIYYVTANLGHCQDSAHIQVNVSPYPTVAVSPDTIVCYGKTVQLHGYTTAASFNWSPAASLLYANTLNPLAGPAVTTTYYLTVQDSFYCPKKVSDSLVVAVQRPTVNAGNDTVVVIGQPLQLHAVANDASYSYLWSPATGMSNAALYDPVVTISSTTQDSIVYTVTVTSAAGCTASDNVTVKIYQTAPDIFVPTAFTPNGDGRNDVLTPILVGISQLDFFRIYNRWGQLVYATSIAGQGWDGSFHGAKQDMGTFVFVAEGRDYKGMRIFRKGTVVLIR